MIDYRYRLQRKGQKKTTCPQCKKGKVFVCYVDTHNNDTVLSEDVGRCDREVNCGYHYTPGDHFKASPDSRPADGYIMPEYKPKPKVNMPAHLMTDSLKNPQQNSFIAYLSSLFPACVVNGLSRQYNIGTSNRFDGSGCVFWFVNKAGQVRYGQIKKFDRTGHTDTYVHTSGDVRKCTDAAHSAIKRNSLKAGRPVPSWIDGYEDQELKIDCFYGEHLLALPENDGKPIAIVEAPKTAIVAGAYFPQFVWLAIGALSYLKRERCLVLAGRKVVLFPDLKAADNWKARIYNESLSDIADFTVSTYLEDNATDADKDKGLDLCDYLEKVDYLQYLKSELIATVTAPDYIHSPGDTIRAFCDRGLSPQYIKDNVLPELKTIAE